MVNISILSYILGNNSLIDPIFKSQFLQISCADSGIVFPMMKLSEILLKFQNILKLT